MHERTFTDSGTVGATPPHTLPYKIILNADAGSVANIGLESLDDILESSVLPIASCTLLSPGELFEAIRNHDPDTSNLLIGGGDGTIRTCAKILHDTDIPFGVLPMGTMNLLARDLGLPTKLGDALTAYAQGCDPVQIDMGFLNDEPFLCCACLGTVPETSIFRESFRGKNDVLAIPRVTIFMLSQMDNLARRHLRVKIDDTSHRMRASSIVVSNNPFIMDGPGISNSFKKEGLRGGKLGVYAVQPKSLWEKIRLVLKLGLGGWRQDPIVTQWTGDMVDIKTHRRRELVSLDGETMHLSTPLSYKIMTQKLKILVPTVPQDQV